MENEKYKLMIIDNEEPAILLVQKYIAEMGKIAVVGTASDGMSAVKAINELKPDIIIIDIHMPKLNGFEVIEIAEHKPFVIFSTAFDNYAVKAFEKNAVDYILKPYSKARLFEAVNRAIDMIESKRPPEISEKVVEDLHQEEKIERVAVKSGSRITVIPIDEVQYIAADGDYVFVVNLEGRAFLKERTMRFFEAALPDKEFVRIHRSFIVNINQIAKIENADKVHEVVLKSGKTIRTSIAGYRNLKNVLGI